LYLLDYTVCVRMEGRTDGRFDLTATIGNLYVTSTMTNSIQYCLYSSCSQCG